LSLLILILFRPGVWRDGVKYSTSLSLHPRINGKPQTDTDGVSTT
jgi:hypothetical protein